MPDLTRERAYAADARHYLILVGEMSRHRLTKEQLRQLERAGQILGRILQACEAEQVQAAREERLRVIHSREEA